MPKLQEKKNVQASIGKGVANTHAYFNQNALVALSQMVVADLKKLNKVVDEIIGKFLNSDRLANTLTNF